MLTDQPVVEKCVTAWLLDEIEKYPSITSRHLSDMVPEYMSRRSVAPALAKLWGDGAVRRERRRTEAGGNTFAYWLVDRDAASAQVERSFRHFEHGPRPPGMRRRTSSKDAQTVEPAAQGEMFPHDAQTKPAAAVLDRNWPGMYGPRTRAPGIKLTAVMDDGTEYTLPPRHARQLHEMLAQHYGQ